MGGFSFVVLALGAAGSVFALEAVQVKSDLEGAKADLAGIVAEVRGGRDAAAIEAAATSALERTTRASDTADGGLWRAMSLVPLVGANVEAVQDAATAVHILVRDALPVGVELLTRIDPGSLSMGDGGLDLRPLQEAQASLPRLTAALDAAAARVAEIDTGRLLPVVADAVSQLTDVIAEAQPAMHLLDRYLPTLLDLAGANGPKEYLVVFQNNAESRAGGGNPSSSAVVAVDNGKISLVESPDVAEFALLGRAGTYLYAFPPEAARLYERDTTGFSQNYTRTPDFPTTVDMFQRLWESVTGRKFDGVISIDPVVLSYMLNATGPIILPDGEELRSDNAVQVLLSDTYERYGMDGDAADEYFAGVTSTFFSVLSSGGWSPLSMIEQMTKAAVEQRIRMWFPGEDADALVRDMGLSGALSADNSEVTEIGLFLNDAAYSKFEYHLSQALRVECDAASGGVEVTTTLTNTLPDSIVSGYTLGWRNASLGIPRRSMILDVLAFAPPGAALLSSDPSTSDIPGWDRSGVEKGHAAESRTIVLAPGETRSVTFAMQLAPGAHGPIHVRYTPTVGETPVELSRQCGDLSGGSPD